MRWHEATGSSRDWVILTPGGWLLYVNAGERTTDELRMRATPELIAAGRGR